MRRSAGEAPIGRAHVAVGGDLSENPSSLFQHVGKFEKLLVSSSRQFVDVWKRFPFHSDFVNIFSCTHN